MKNKIYNALDIIKAEEQLKQNTYAFLQEKAYRKKKTTFKRFAVAFASVIVLFVAGLFSYNLYFTEAAFIDIDVNPSMEITLNRFDRIIGIYAYNDDGQKVLNEVNIRHKTYEEALKILIDKMVEMGYIKDDGLFTATLQMKNGANEKELLDSLKAYIDTALKFDEKTPEQDVFSVDSATKIHSHEENLTPAKYLAILELQEVDPTVTFESCRNHSIGEIKQQTHDHKNEEHRNNESEHENENGHSGGSDNKDHDSSNSGNDTEDKKHDSTDGLSKEHESSNKTESHENNAPNNNPTQSEDHRKDKEHGNEH